MRHQGDNGFVNNVLAAFVATAVSSPFNYARMKIYGSALPVGEVDVTKSFSRATTGQVLSELRKEVLAQGPGLFARAQYTFRILNIGWGALRVGLGMGVGSQIYKSCCNNLL